MINVLWVYALKMMSDIAPTEKERAHFEEQFLRTKSALMEKIYDADRAYFKTAEGENRIDVPATILGALFFLDASECVRAEEALDTTVKRPSGFLNFNPPYPQSAILLPFKIINDCFCAAQATIHPDHEIQRGFDLIGRNGQVIETPTGRSWPPQRPWPPQYRLVQKRPLRRLCGHPRQTLYKCSPSHAASVAAPTG